MVMPIDRSRFAEIDLDRPDAELEQGLKLLLVPRNRFGIGEVEHRILRRQAARGGFDAQSLLDDFRK
ncbi:hypothetical protein D3C83_296050 [compost metagenome]